MKKNLLLTLFILFALIANAQWIDSVRVINKNSLTSNDTVIVRAYGYFSDTGWGIDTSWCNINGNSIDFTIKSCAHGVGLSVIVLYNVNKKINPLNSGLYNLKVKILGYSNTIVNNVSIPCSTVVTKDSLMTTFQISEPNDLIEEHLEDELKLFPNPANQKLIFRLNNSNTVIEKLYINDLLGQKVFEKDHPLPDQSIDISSLQKGVYFLVIKSHGRNKSYKFIKD